MLSVLLALQIIALIIALLFEKTVSGRQVQETLLITAQSHTLFLSLPSFSQQTFELFQKNIRQGIKHYYDDLDFKNILDYVQEKVGDRDGVDFSRRIEWKQPEFLSEAF